MDGGRSALSRVTVKTIYDITGIQTTLNAIQAPFLLHVIHDPEICYYLLWSTFVRRMDESCLIDQGLICILDPIECSKCVVEQHILILDPKRLDLCSSGFLFHWIF
jgi:hypothetical protein